KKKRDGKIVWLRLEPPQIDGWCLLLTLSTVFVFSTSFTVFYLSAIVIFLYISFCFKVF
ncbi:unnamed protein product, partial [Arabidopsis halleri]